MADVETALGYLSSIFELDSVTGQFTINQTNAAWVGSGLGTFLEAINSQSERYQALPEDFTLDQYKSEQAVFICNPSLPYPESVLIIYIEPWVSDEFARHFQIALFTNGTPVNNRPLNEFGDETGIKFGPTESVSFEPSGISRPEQIPVELAEQVRTTVQGISSEESHVTGYLVQNPFYRSGDLLSEHLNVNDTTHSSLGTFCNTHRQTSKRYLRAGLPSLTLLTSQNYR
jgi:hypothetical protein